MSSPAWRSTSSVRSPATADEVEKLRQAATVRCSKGLLRRETTCNPSLTHTLCLFDIRTDPCEQTDLSSTNADIATKMYDLLLRHRRLLVPQLNKPWDLTGADPAKFNNTWTSWLDWMSKIVHENIGNVLVMFGHVCVSPFTERCSAIREKRFVLVLFVDLLFI